MNYNKLVSISLISLASLVACDSDNEQQEDISSFANILTNYYDLSYGTILELCNAHATTCYTQDGYAFVRYPNNLGRKGYIPCVESEYPYSEVVWNVVKGTFTTEVQLNIQSTDECRVIGVTSTMPQNSYIQDMNSNSVLALTRVNQFAEVQGELDQKISMGAKVEINKLDVDLSTLKMHLVRPGDEHSPAYFSASVMIDKDLKVQVSDAADLYPSNNVELNILQYRNRNGSRQACT